LRDLLDKLRASEVCRQADLVDPITVFMATGLRRSELLALRWEDFDEDAGTITVSGKIARIQGVGLRRLDSGKTDSSERTVALPEFAITALVERPAGTSAVHRGHSSCRAQRSWVNTG